MTVVWWMLGFLLIGIGAIMLVEWIIEKLSKRK